MTHPAQLTTAENVINFTTAGNATFTIKSTATGTRFTYKMRQCKDKGDLYFISLLSGSDNEGDYAYLGTVRSGAYSLGRKSRITDTAPSHRAFEWFWRHAQAGNLPTTVECWHEGRCGRCGRKLTVPESIEQGIGPECAGRMQ